MSDIHYGDKHIQLAEGEAVLDGLLREGVSVNFGCRSGVCQSCIMVCEQGKVPANAQKGLKEGQKALNYFLACQCKPEQPITIADPDKQSLIQPAKVLLKEWLNDQVMRLRLEANQHFNAGQYTMLWRDDALGRCYSIASVPSEGYLEYHIKVLANGEFSQWLKRELKPGDSIGVQAPAGLCFYQHDAKSPLLLAGIGTGFAPLYGVLKDALANNHRGEINLIFGARDASNFYLLDELQTIARQNQNLHVHLVALEADCEDVIQEDIYRYTNSHFGALKDTKVHLCGADSFVKKMRRQCFMNGANMTDIHADSFVAFG